MLSLPDSSGATALQRPQGRGGAEGIGVTQLSQVPCPFMRGTVAGHHRICMGASVPHPSLASRAPSHKSRLLLAILTDCKESEIA